MSDFEDKKSQAQLELTGQEFQSPISNYYRQAIAFLSACDLSHRACTYIGQALDEAREISMIGPEEKILSCKAELEERLGDCIESLNICSKEVAKVSVRWDGLEFDEIAESGRVLSGAASELKSSLLELYTEVKARGLNVPESAIDRYNEKLLRFKDSITGMNAASEIQDYSVDHGILGLNLKSLRSTIASVPFPVLVAGAVGAGYLTGLFFSHHESA